jgi:hypothetical protein
LAPVKPCINRMETEMSYLNSHHKKP